MYNQPDAVCCCSTCEFSQVDSQWVAAAYWAEAVAARVAQLVLQFVNEELDLIARQLEFFVLGGHAFVSHDVPMRGRIRQLPGQ